MNKYVKFHKSPDGSNDKSNIYEAEGIEIEVNNV